MYHLAEVSAGGQSLGALIDSITVALSSSASAAEEFDEKLASLRYLDLPEYRLHEFAVVKQDTFTVSEGFPRIIPTTLISGIHDVNYCIQLAALVPFQTTISWSKV